MTESSILVCGNGPSCSQIDFKRVPVETKIMRMTNFCSCHSSYQEFSMSLSRMHLKAEITPLTVFSVSGDCFFVNVDIHSYEH
jgi:hypothetical protein